jgi:hypothetical protein
VKTHFKAWKGLSYETNALDIMLILELGKQMRQKHEIFDFVTQIRSTFSLMLYSVRVLLNLHVTGCQQLYAT